MRKKNAENNTQTVTQTVTRTAGVMKATAMALCMSGAAMLLQGCSAGADVGRQAETAQSVLSAPVRADVAKASEAYAEAYAYDCGVDTDYEQLKTMYEEAVSSGSARALYRLGLLHEGGKLGERDGETARAYFERAIEEDEAGGYAGLGILSYYGVGTARDYAEALSFFRQAAEQKDADGLGWMGYFYASGSGGLTRDDAEALRYYEAAAAAPEGEGWNADLGDVYFYGLGVERDFERAAAYYQAAAEAGSSAGYYGLYKCALYGQGLPQEKETAIGYLELALSHNPANSNVASELADRYFRGDGVAQDTEKALAILEQGAAYKNTSIMDTLATVYRDGDYVTRDIDRAISLYAQAAAEGDLYGDVYIAYLYAEENGVEKDLEKAGQMILAAYENAPDEGEELVTNLVPWYLYYSEDESDKEKGFALIRDYCERHPYNTSALLRLGGCYRDGLGTAENMTAAMDCFEQAVAHGSIDAYSYIAWMYMNGNGVAKDAAKARALWEEALSIDPDHKTTLGNLGESYFREEAYETALSYYEQTKELGYNDYLINIANAISWMDRYEDFVDAARYAAERITGSKHAQACRALGIALRNESAKQDVEEAVIWFKEGAYALPADAGAMLEYAWHCHTGTGVGQDDAEAFRFFKEAAERENASAMYWTGACYMKGWGVEADTAKAIEYLEKAKENGAPQENIDELLQEIR